MNFREFAERAEELEEESSDKKMAKMVAKILEESGEDLEETARFVRGEIFPSWDNTKTNVGPSLAYDAISEFTGASEEEIEQKVIELGDEGAACERIVNCNQRQETLFDVDETTVGEVYDNLEEIANTSGSGSKEKKVNLLSATLSGMSPLETKYLIRLVLNVMRIGVGNGTVRDGISIAFDVPSEKAERGYMMSNDYGRVAKVAREEGKEGLDNINMEVGKPVNPMKAKSSDAVDDIVSDLGGNVAAEIKFDGARFQIHKDDKEVHLFSRGLNDETKSLPDVVEKVREEVNSDEVILDCEVVAYEDGEPLDFNDMQKRLNRKYNIEEKVEEINLDIKVFDILYNEGEVLIDKPLKKRREILEQVYPEPAESYSVDTEEDISRLREMAVQQNNEGLVVKDRDSRYTPNKRGKRWIKVKPKAETIDCVVTGGKWGKGNREGCIGTYEISLLDGDDEFSKVGKVGNGLTDDQLERLTERFKPLINSEDGMEVSFTPEVVFEVSYEEIQESPDSGFSLRFPVLKTVRDDKEVEDADTIERLEDIY